MATRATNYSLETLERLFIQKLEEKLTTLNLRTITKGSKELRSAAHPSLESRGFTLA
jgi:hypothetical protein